MATSSRLMVLMFTDIVGSVEMKGRLGAAAYAGVIGRHDGLFRACVERCRGAQVMQDTGDGFLARFETASDAVVTALRFQSALRAEEWGHALSVRIGLNLGQVTEVEGQGGTKYVGLATDIAARVMSLAQGGQILMTRAIFDDARQYVREHPGEGAEEAPALQWMAHGEYLFKGADEAIDVFEVGAAMYAPLCAPPNSDKAKRAVSAMEEETLGWRPAAGLEVPRRRGWVLTQKLGEGGFGEVWLGKHSRTKESRVFKFCFDAERLKSFRRELMLFRLLREGLGERKDIAQLFEVQFEEPPYFLESEYSGFGSLSEWAAKQGGLDKVPLDLRIDMVARVADAVAAAHSLGVMHKDIKPSNILMYMSEDGVPRPRLADFGIGVATDRSELERRNITMMTGMTEGLLDGNESSRTGTRMYAPPESLTNQKFTMQGDIYALGVFLYQMAVGDFNRPLATGWEASVPDELLREDIRACTMGEAEKRLGSAKELADRLRALPARRRALRAARRRKWIGIGAGVAAILAVVGGAWGFQQYSLRQRAEKAEVAARELSRNQAETAIQYLAGFDEQIQALEGASKARRVALQSAVRFLERLVALDPTYTGAKWELVKTHQRLGDVQGGSSSANAADKEAAMKSYEAAAALNEEMVKQSPEDGLLLTSLATCHYKVGDLLNKTENSARAIEQCERALGMTGKAAALRWDIWPNGSPSVANRLSAVIELKLSDIYRSQNNLEKAREYLDKSIAHRKGVMEENPGDEQAMRDYAVGLGRRGKTLEAEKDYEGALEAWKQSVAIRERIAALPESEESMRRKRDLAQGRTELGVAYRNVGKIDEACEQGRLSVEAIKALIVTDEKDERLKLTLADSLMSYVGSLRTARNYGDAIMANAEQISAINKYLETTPTDQTALYLLVQAQHKRGELNAELGQKQESRASFEQALLTIETIKRLDPSEQRTDRWREAALRELASLNGQSAPTEGARAPAASPTG